MATREMTPRRRAADHDPSLTEQRLDLLENIAEMLAAQSAEHTAIMHKLDRRLSTLADDLVKAQAAAIKEALEAEDQSLIDKFVSRVAASAQRGARRSFLDAVWSQLLIGWKFFKSFLIAILLSALILGPLGMFPYVLKAWNALAPEKWRLL